MKHLRSLLIALVALTGAACSSSKTHHVKELTAGKDYLITIHTDFGEMKAVLYNETPKHKENFLHLIDTGYFDQTIFHRIIKDFMIQGGELNKDQKQFEEVDYRIDAEFHKPYFHKKGALAAARMGDHVNPERRSSGAQFYIVQGKKLTEKELTTDVQELFNYYSRMLSQPEYKTLQKEMIELQKKRDFEAIQARVLESREKVEKEFGISFGKEIPADRLKGYVAEGGAPHLDDQYTVFGQVVEGLDIIDKIASQETAKPNDRPVEEIKMTMTVEQISKKKIKKLYGIDL